MQRLPLVIFFLLTAAWAAAEEVPFAGDDFYPSPERPVGFHGDGGGYFPGARLVTEWWGGTPVQREQEYRDKRGRTKKEGGLTLRR